MSKTEKIPGDTYVPKNSNPSGLKRASGDNASGMDAATLNAVAMNIGANVVLDSITIHATVDKAAQSHLNNTNITSISAAQKVEKRSEKINELAFGMQGKNFQSTKVNSLGDMMCELMILMIQSTSERRKMEREMRTLLVVSNLDQSKKIAEEIMEKAEAEIKQQKESAIFQVAAAGVNFVANVGLLAKPTRGESFFLIQRNLQYSRTVSDLTNSFATFGDMATADEVRKIAQLEADITKQRAAITLTKSVADSVQTSLSDIDSTREFFLDMMSQISRAEHDAKMQIIRNSRV